MPEKSGEWLVMATILFIGFGICTCTWFGWFLPNVIWLLYAGAARLIGLDHPLAPDNTPLTTRQKIMGWAAILIFILCFSPNSITLT